MWEAEYKTYKLLKPLYDQIIGLKNEKPRNNDAEELDDLIYNLESIFDDLDTRLDQLDEVHSYKPPEYLVTEVEDLLAT